MLITKRCWTRLICWSKEKYESQINILKSRLRNLTSQINSHFLFNTLENISCLAQLEGNKQIVIMTKSLGDMLRYTMDIDGDYITLEKEIGQMQRYLNIQEVLFRKWNQLGIGTWKRSFQEKDYEIYA
mgnify:CR=1 FL=1